MKLIFTMLALTILSGSQSWATYFVEDTFPVPAAAPNRLFYIQKSNNINTVIYEANPAVGQRLDQEQPVSVYWIRYAERGQREKLSGMQWSMAYGYKHRSLKPSSSEVEIKLNAFKKRAIHVAYQNGKPIALTTINGRRAQLHKIFVQLDPDSGLIPKVQYVELFGTDPAENRPVRERIDV